jgi:hypothetical protein
VAALEVVLLTVALGAAGRFLGLKQPRMGQRRILTILVPEVGVAGVFRVVPAGGEFGSRSRVLCF